MTAGARSGSPDNEVGSALETLCAAEPFRHAAPETLQALAAEATACHFPAGQTLMRQGERRDDVLIIARGTVDVRAQAPR